MSASLALAGVSAACTVQPDELIVPYVRQPEEEIPGRPLFFATAMTLGGIATGLLVESHEGRPTKAEGNPNHPGSLGATDLYAQASLLTLYDPDRSQSDFVQLGEIRPWSAFISAVRASLSAQSATQGSGLRVLTETVVSPTLGRQLQEILKAYPTAKWIQWEPVPAADNVRAGARAAFGQYVQPVYDFTRADIVLSLDADFLSSEGAANLRYARQFSSRRRLDAQPDRLNRLYVAEPTPSVTGSNADHRIPLKASAIDSLARAIAARIGVAGVTGAAPAGTEPYVEAIAQDLSAHRGTSLVVAGEAQPPAVHALAHAMNQALGNVDATVTYQPTPEIVPTDQHAAMRELVSDMNAGRVQMLLIVGESNPVQTAPADLRFADALSKVQTRFHSGLFLDETATLCHWHVPAAHYLEAWSDARTVDGTTSIVQPLIQPMYGGKSAHEIVATLSDQSRARRLRRRSRLLDGAAASGCDRCVRCDRCDGCGACARCIECRCGSVGQSVRAHCGKPIGTSAGGTSSSPRALHHRHERPSRSRRQRSKKIGGVGCTTDLFRGPRSLRHLRHLHLPHPVTTALVAPIAPSAPVAPAFEVNFRRDPTIYDGRFANNGWLRAAETNHQADVGQRGVDRPGNRRATEPSQRQSHQSDPRGSRAPNTDLDQPGSRDRRHHDSCRLWPHPRGACGQRHGLQRLRVAWQHVALVTAPRRSLRTSTAFADLR